MPEKAEEKIEAIKVPSFVTVGEFAARVGQPVGKVVAELMKNGVLATINETIDFDTAAIVAEYLGVQIEEEAGEKKERKAAKKGKVTERAPVVTIMGHVDHGKTSLLDAIRETEVAAGEAGGITQHIGAYQVHRNKKPVTFLDTPGHEAFSAMRAHGANVTDVVVLVVAADDGVKPQTIEAATLAKSAGVPTVVAVNKIDKPGADVNRVLGELANIGLNPEQWGGDTVTVEISAKQKTNLDKLLDMVLLVSEMKNLKAEEDVPASGVVIESHVDFGKGSVATVLIQNGTLNIGDYIQAGHTYGRVKLMEDFRGKKLKEAGPATPIKISGFKEVPSAAEPVQVFPSEQDARAEADLERKRRSAKKFSAVKKISVDAITESVKAGEVKELLVILKADVAGSLTALLESIGKIKNDEVAVKVVSSAVGEINDSDIELASSTGAVVFGFNVGIAGSSNAQATKKGVKVAIYDVIYELLGDIKNALSKLLAPEKTEIETGIMKILKIFMTGKADMIIGGRVESGKISSGNFIEIKRGGEIITTGRISKVQKEKSVVEEAVAGSEFGLGVSIEAPKLVKEGDVVRAYRVEEKVRTLG